MRQLDLFIIIFFIIIFLSLKLETNLLFSLAKICSYVRGDFEVIANKQKLDRSHNFSGATTCVQFIVVKLPTTENEDHSFN